jgi:hypothetical protein
MGFLRDLFNWFITGSVPAETTSAEAPVLEVIKPEEPAAEKKEERRKTPKNVPDDIRSLGRREDFLEELRSLETPRKQYDKAREDLVAEIKKLSTKKKD